MRKIFPLAKESKTNHYSFRLWGKPFMTEMRKKYFIQGLEPSAFYTLQGCRGLFKTK